jgi:hypothetical protein
VAAKMVVAKTVKRPSRPDAVEVWKRAAFTIGRLDTMFDGEWWMVDGG